MWILGLEGLTIMPTKHNKGNVIHSDLIGVHHVIYNDYDLRSLVTSFLHHKQ